MEEILSISTIFICLIIFIILIISSSTSTTKNVQTHSKIPKEKTPLLKLDTKFELPMYNEEVNAEKLDNWIRQLEVYCRIQNLQ